MGRTNITISAMAVSGTFAVIMGFMFGVNVWLLTVTSKI